MRQASGANSSGDDEFSRRLADDISILRPGETITIAEFTPEGVTTWRIRLDLAGTPIMKYRPVWWPDLTEDGVPIPGKLAGHIQPATPARLSLTTCGYPSQTTQAALRQTRALHPDAVVYPVSRPVPDLFEHAVTRVPLSQSYELAAVREGRHEALILTPYRLFPPGARPGDTERVTFQAETAGDERLVFAVLALDEDTDHAQYRAVQPLQSAPLPPGTYELRATLARRGKVRFEGLPKPLDRDERTIAEVLDSVPPQRSSASPVHLIIAIELCEPDDRYAQRIDCASRLVAHIASDRPGSVRYSVVGYGSHSFTRMTKDPVVEEVCWNADSHRARSALEDLESRTATSEGSPHEAQLECALDAIAQRLEDESHAGGRTTGRPVLVTIGTRPPFPAGQPDQARVLPCPHRVSWKDAVQRMTAQYSRMTFGALYDGDDPESPAWGRLGRHARGAPSGFHPRQFATVLGLLVPGSRSVPLPVVLFQEGRD